MTHTTHAIRCAGTAIAAALALTTTPTLAQDGQAPFPTAPAPPPVAPVPEIVVPDIPVAEVPEPTIVLPAEPVEPVSRPEATAPAQPEAAPPPAATRSTAPAERTPVRTSEPVAPAAEPAPSEATVIEPPVAPVVADPLPALPAETAAADSGSDSALDTGILAMILGGLAFLALAIWGFVAIGRRKPIRRYSSTTPEARTAVATPAVAATPREPIVSDPRPVSTVVTPLATAAPAAGLLPHAGASVALPRRLPDSFEAREALFRRMIDARPDRANPFTDRKSRMKRARLIMQSIGRDFGGARPWIDLSQYPHNWPELAQQDSAAA